MLVGTISFSTVAAILFLVWGGIEIMPGPERIPIPSNPAASLDSAMSAGLAPAGTSRPITSILIGIQDRQGLVNEPIPLGGMLFGAGEEAIHITGLTEGSRLSAGEKLGSSGWQIPPRELAGVVVVPPASFIGTMRTVIQLRSSGNVPVDTQVARYEWVAKLTDREARPQPKANDVSQPIAPAGKLDQQRSAQLVKRGVELLRIGDFAAARLVLRPAAEAGDAEAALLLGATFDPAAVADLGALGLAPDPNVARAWYQRALDAGSVEASRRIERLTRTAQ
jgi:TPR repeat protein